MGKENQAEKTPNTRQISKKMRKVRHREKELPSKCIHISNRKATEEPKNRSNNAKATTTTTTTAANNGKQRKKKCEKVRKDTYKYIIV